MKRTGLRKIDIAGIAALVLVIAGLRISTIYAANEIDLSKPCSLTLQVADSGTFTEDLAQTELKVKLYQVADVSINRQYTAVGEFQSLEMEELVSGNKSWEEAALQAAEIAGDQEADAEFTMIDGTGTAENLKAGIYLVLVEDGITDFYEYRFSPYLIALPDNLYAQSGNPEDDYWQYDAVGGLKPEQSPRYGDLKIRKTLTSYNTSLNDVSFVFQVEGVDGDGNIVYSNVVSAAFDAAGTKEITVSHIPAGVSVTVTEVYSGASYRVEAASEQTVVISADEAVTADFSNSYDDELVPGYGVTNHFDYDEDEGWQWSELKDNSTE